jgi:hypothetical protein
MLPRKSNAVGSPNPVDLAAYADGELKGIARERVQSWLIEHPEAAADVDAIRSLDRLCQGATPSEPSETSWTTVLQRIEKQVEQGRRQCAAAGRPRLLRILVPLTAAAAVLLAVFVHQRASRETISGESLEPLPVATADDIEIISMDDGDRSALVIGKPPLFEPMVLVAAGDTSEIHIQPDSGDGMKPSIARPVDGMATTMIVAPLSAGVDDKDP